MKSLSTHMDSNASGSYIIISLHISLQSCQCICDVIKIWVWPGTSANYEIHVTFSLLYLSCPWTKTGTQFLWGAAFISLSFLSNYLHNPPSFISKWYQEVFPWYNSQRMYQTFSYCRGLNVWGNLPPCHLSASVVWCLCTETTLYFTVIKLFFVL